MGVRFLLELSIFPSMPNNFHNKMTAQCTDSDLLLLPFPLYYSITHSSSEDSEDISLSGRCATYVYNILCIFTIAKYVLVGISVGQFGSFQEIR